MDQISHKIENVKKLFSPISNAYIFHILQNAEESLTITFLREERMYRMCFPQCWLRKKLQELMIPIKGVKFMHPKSVNNGEDYLSAQKNWRKKCVHQDIYFD